MEGFKCTITKIGFFFLTHGNYSFSFYFFQYLKINNNNTDVVLTGPMT